MTHNDLLRLVATHPLLAVYVTLPGCAPCEAVRPWLEPLFDDPPWHWVAVDSSQAPDIAGQLLVFAHPTLVLFRDGREVARFSRVFRRREVERAHRALPPGG